MNLITHSKFVLYVLTLMFIFTGCKEEKFGFVNLNTWKNINIHIDGKFKAIAGEGATKIKLTEGKHLIKVEGDSVDGEWHYEIEKEILVAADVETNISLIPIQYPTKQRLQRLEEEKKRKLAEAQRYGCQTIEDYEKYQQVQKEITRLEDELKPIELVRIELKKDNGYIIKNDYLDLVSFSVNGDQLSIKLKNKTKDKITYFWSYFYLVDNKLNILTEFKKYKEYIEIEPLSTQSFSFRLSSSTLRVIENKIVKYLFMDLDSIRFSDKFGKNSKSFSGFNLRSKIQNASDKTYIKIKNELKEYKNRISMLCTNK